MNPFITYTLQMLAWVALAILAGWLVDQLVQRSQKPSIDEVLPNASQETRSSLAQKIRTVGELAEVKDAVTRELLSSAVDLVTRAVMLGFMTERAFHQLAAPQVDSSPAGFKAFQYQLADIVEGGSGTVLDRTAHAARLREIIQILTPMDESSDDAHPFIEEAARIELYAVEAGWFSQFDADRAATDLDELNPSNAGYLSFLDWMASQLEGRVPAAQVA